MALERPVTPAYPVITSSFSDVIQNIVAGADVKTELDKAVKAIGPVDIDYGDDNSCEPLDVMKHLTSDAMKKKFK